MSYDTLLAVERTLGGATTFAAVFGQIDGGTFDAKKGRLRSQFSLIAKTVHPDVVERAYEQKAKDVFELLMAFRDAAEEALKADTYAKPFPKGKPPTVDPGSVPADAEDFVLASASAHYRLDVQPYASGDFSTLYRGRTIAHAPERVIVKVANAPAQNAWLESEARLLARFRDAPKGTPLAAIASAVPRLLDTFLVEDGGRRLRANVLPLAGEHMTITEILRAFPKGLDPRDAAWMARRVVAQTLAAKAAGVVLGSIVPDHVLVHPVTHDPIHLGWAHAVPADSGPRRLTHVIARWKAYYPPEVFRKEAVGHKSDIYMAGKVMVALFGGDPVRNSLPASLPKNLAALVLRCVEASPAARPKDGAAVLDDLTRVVRDAWGKAYRPLLVPGR